jgi:hypothetical protein
MHQAGQICYTCGMYQGKRLRALHYSPARNGKVGAAGTEYHHYEITDYPFGDRILWPFATSAYVSAAVAHSGWCKEAELTLNGKPLRTEKGAGW